MTTERDFDRIADAWLADGPIELSDHALRSAITEVRVTRQRRVGRWPWAGQARMAAAGVATVSVVAAVAILAVAVQRGAPAQVASTSPSPVALIPADRGVFTPTGSMLLARELPSATLLRDGRVLVIGGYGGETSGAGTFPGGTGPLASAEVWDPATGLFAPAGAMREARYPVATLLLDGRVLVVGPASEEDPPSAEIWDPSTMSFGPTGSPKVRRFRPSATLLADGRVLISGGQDANGGELASAEVWDPATGAFDPADAIPEENYPVGTLLEDGRVLVLTDVVTTDANGARTHGLAAASVLDPSTGSSIAAGSLATARGSDFTTTRLLDGRVLIAGGNGCLKGRGACNAVTAAEIWDPSTMSSSPTGPLGEPRYLHAAALLLDGRVLVVGGGLSAKGSTAEVFELR